MEILIHKEIGTRCLVKEDGQKIYDIISPMLLEGESVVLNFDGVTQYASPFFNFSIGQIIINLPGIKFKQQLEIVNLNETGHLIVDRVIKNATKYQSDFDYRAILGKVLTEQSKEHNE